jgi:hypothetical protein
VCKQGGRQHRIRTERAYPGENGEGVRFALHIIRQLPWAVRNIIVIVARGEDEAQLIARSRIEDQRAEAAVAIFRVMNDLSHRRLDP